MRPPRSPRPDPPPCISQRWPFPQAQLRETGNHSAGKDRHVQRPFTPRSFFGSVRCQQNDQIEDLRFNVNAGARRTQLSGVDIELEFSE